MVQDDQSQGSISLLTDRRKFLKRSAAATGVFGGLLSNTLPAHAKSSSSYDRDDADLIFPVISDTHVKRDSETDPEVQSFRESLRQLNQVTPNRDGMVVVGDLTDHGYTEEYDRFNTALSDVADNQSKQLFAIGNHDYWNGLSVEKAQDRFLQKTDMNSLYYHEVINGYHFIVLATEDGDTAGTFTTDQINWLGDQLAVASADDPEKPIFVFHHQPIRGTVYGQEWGFEQNRDLLYDTLKQYPQVISFSGHTHYPLDDPRIIWQGDFTAIGTATTSYMWIDDGRLQGEVPPNADTLNQGLVVEAYGDDVVIRRRDFHDDAWTDEPLTVESPGSGGEFKYTEDRDSEPPQFPERASLSIAPDETAKTSLDIEIPQATDNLLVHDYMVTVTDQQSGDVERQYLAFSEFYKDPIPDPLTLPVDGLNSGTEYEIEVRAIDAFGNESDTTLSTVGKTEAQVGDLPRDTTILTEDFDGLSSSLQPAQDESIDESVLGWTHTAPEGWDVEVAKEMPQGVTEWQGWSFTTMEFWTAADGQGRSEFTGADKVFAVADTDEWDDKNSPASEGTFDSTLVSESVDLPNRGSVYVGFDSEYRQYDELTAQLLVSFDGGEDKTVLQYDDQPNSDNGGGDVRNAHPVIELPVPEDADSMVLKWRLSNGGNDWYWAIDNVEVIARAPPVATINAPSEATVGERLGFRVNDTTENDRWITSLDWTFGDGTSGTGWYNAHRFSSRGSYEVRLTATDNTGTSTTDRLTVDISDLSDSIAEIQPSKTTVAVDERVEFRVIDTSGNNRWIDSLDWTFGDDTTGSGWYNAHRYDSPGSYNVTLTATDNTGASTTHAVTISVS